MCLLLPCLQPPPACFPLTALDPQTPHAFPHPSPGQRKGFSPAFPMMGWGSVLASVSASWAQDAVTLMKPWAGLGTQSLCGTQGQTQGTTTSSVPKGHRERKPFVSRGGGWPELLSQRETWCILSTEEEEVKDSSRETKIRGVWAGGVGKDSTALGFTHPVRVLGVEAVTSLCKATSNPPSTDVGGTQPYSTAGWSKALGTGRPRAVKWSQRPHLQVSPPGISAGLGSRAWEWSHGGPSAGCAGPVRAGPRAASLETTAFWNF